MPKRSLLAYCITLPTKCLSSVRFLLVTKMQLATLMHKQDVYDLEVRHRNDIRLQISPSNCEIGVHSCRCDAHLVCCPLIPRPVLWPWICGAVWLRYPVPSCSRNAFNVFYAMKMCRWVSAEMLWFVCRRGDSWVFSTSGSNGTALKDLSLPVKHIFFIFCLSSKSPAFTLFCSRDCWEPVTPSRLTACKTYPGPLV